MNTAVCKNRSDDRSRDYARYPTLAPLTSASSGDWKDYLHCPGCGGTAFRYRLADRTHICLHCRRAIAPDTPPSTVIDIALGEYHAVALHRDGTVRAVGRNLEGQCDVRGWKDITAIAVGPTLTMGVKKDGTVVNAGKLRGRSLSLHDWTGIRAIAAGDNHVVGLRADGTVVAAGSNTSRQCAVQSWTGICAIATDNDYILGLRADGTVVGTGRWFHDIEVNPIVEHWTQITDLAVSGLDIFGLRADGTLCGDHFTQTDAGWTDLRAIAAGLDGLFAIGRDGTILAEEKTPPTDSYLDNHLVHKVTAEDEARYDRYNRIRSWTDIRTLFAGRNDVIGLKTDGTFVFTSSEREACYRELFA